MPGRPPPGRAGRVWLAERVQAARRAADLLEQKHRLLRSEQRRLAELADRTGHEWAVAAARAEVWNARALVTGGRDELRRRTPGVGEAHARISWTTHAGVTYPSTAAAELPPPLVLAGPAALPRAATACRAALDAAVRHAAATTALDRVDVEVVATIRRLRAVRDRWLPRLEARLADLDLRLEEVEREEQARGRPGGDRSLGTVVVSGEPGS